MEDKDAKQGTAHDKDTQTELIQQHLLRCEDVLAFMQQTNKWTDKECRAVVKELFIQYNLYAENIYQGGYPRT